jgi:hypothetical protein
VHGGTFKVVLDVYFQLQKEKIRMLIRAYSFSICVITLSNGVASADPVAASFSVTTTFCQNASPASCIDTSRNLAFISNTQHFSSTSTLGGETVTSLFDGTAFARAAFGSLGASANLTLTDYRDNTYLAPDGPGVFPAAAGIAAFTDYLTIFGRSGSGLLHLSFLVNGFGSDTAPFTGPVTAAKAVLEVGNTQTLTDLPRGSSLQQFDVPFTFGTQFKLPVELFAGFFLFDDPTYLSFFDRDLTDPYSYTGTVNFADSVNLVGATVTDISHNPISGTSITSLSGFDYAAVPEPYSLPVLIVAVGTLIIHRCVKFRGLQ